MDTVFITIINMSISAGWMIFAVILVRALFRRMPKAVCCFLWGMVGLRLICPFSVESVLSLIPSAQTIPEKILYETEPAIHSGIKVLNTTVNPILSESFAPQAGDSVNPLQVVSFVAGIIWIAGIAAMVLYGIISCARLHKRVKISVPLTTLSAEFGSFLPEREKQRVYVCDEIVSPFILGVFRPRIYLPSVMTEGTQIQVLAHEYAHLKRKDHWWKPLGFVLLCVYWFHPLVWVAYILLCRDVEMACDEAVIREYGEAEKKKYSEALLSCSASYRMAVNCPLAFGEINVRNRIQAVLKYKKPALAVLLFAGIICLVLALCFLTDPLSEKLETGTAGSAAGVPAGIAGNGSGEIYVCYEYEESVDFMSPTLTLGVNNPRFSFSWSALSSYLAFGTYEKQEDKIILRTDDGLYTYVFDSCEEGYRFNGEESSMIPKYRYKSGGPAESPVPDGALFRSGAYSGPDGTPSASFANISGDFDRDGIEEIYILGIGPTSGIFTFTLKVYESNTLQYFNIFNSPYSSNLRFSVTPKEELNISCEEWKYIDGEHVYIQNHNYSVLYEDGNVVLEENGERMAYWGEQGPDSVHFR